MVMATTTRRNLIAAATILVVGPLGLWAMAAHERTQYPPVDAQYPDKAISEPVTVEATTQDVVARTSWTGDITVHPASARIVTEPEAPLGTKVMVVTIPVERTDENLSCSVAQISEIGGKGRTWRPDFSTLPYDAPYITHTRCPTPGNVVLNEEHPRDAELTVPVILPRDAMGPFEVYLSIPSLSPEHIITVVTP